MITNHRETGFTLIELMASLLIASILLLAMYQNFVVSQRSHQLLEGYSLLQENARFSEIVLARSIRTAGYRTNPFITMDGVFPASGTAATPTVSTFPAAGQITIGSSWSFQHWYRDGAGPCGTHVNVSSGQRITFLP